MTTQQLHLFNCLYLAALIVAAFFTHATARRIAGALAGGAAFGVVALGVFTLGEAVGWWGPWIIERRPPYLLSLLYLDFVMASAPVYLLTWRVARRFGWPGLAVVVVFLAIIGPVWDRWFMTRFEWGTFGPGVAPVLASSVGHALLVPLGQSVMRLVAGPARASPLARPPWEPTRGPFRPIAIGAVGGGLLSVASVLLYLVGAGYDWQRVMEDSDGGVLLLSVFGGLAGTAIGLAVWVLRPRRLVSMPWLVLSRGLLGGLVAVLLFYVLSSVFAWVTGMYFFRGPKPMEMDIRAVSVALVQGFIFLIYFGLPVFAGGSIVGAFVAPVTRAR